MEKLADSFHSATVARITSSTTVELGGVIWALILILHDTEAHRHIIHCDSEVAILLTTGVYRPGANRSLVRIARVLYDELKDANKITLM